MTTKTGFAVVGLGFGDEGKGGIVDWLCATQDVEYVVRFNGGCQAAHNVVTETGLHHTFAQHGSGTLRGKRTILSRHMMVDPIGFLSETDALRSFLLPDIPKMALVDEQCLLTTPWHMGLNRLQERERRHGTCGLGVGATAQFALEEEWAAPRVGHILDGSLKWRLQALALWCRDRGVTDTFDLDSVHRFYTRFSNEVMIIDNATIRGITANGRCVFEGAQGVLLDEWHGFHPHTTWSTTTFDNALDLVPDPDTIQRIGVLRSYLTRHGAGPFPTEQPSIGGIVKEMHNDDDGPQGMFRTGDFDMKLAEYALKACRGVDSIALTHLDTATDHGLLDVCMAYEVDGEPWGPEPKFDRDLDRQWLLTQTLALVEPIYLQSEKADDLVAAVEQNLGVPVSVVSHGPTARDKHARAARALVG